MEAQIFANPFSLLLKIEKFNLIDSFKGVHKIFKWRYNNSEKHNIDNHAEYMPL